MQHALTIAGSDSGGGAGIQADLKTFSALGIYGMSVITSITAQNTQGVEEIEDLTPEIVEAQLEAVYKDIKVNAVKIGMVSRIGVIKTISKILKKYKEKNIVLDPFMVSESGHSLLEPEAKETLIKELFPVALVVTPNIYEAETILNTEIETIADMKEAAKSIVKLGAQNVIVKGGHLEDEAIDVFYNGKEYNLLETKKIKTQNTHGTGCTFSSAIASYLAETMSLKKAVSKSKKYITSAIKTAPNIGKGAGPVNHFHEVYN